MTKSRFPKDVAEELLVRSGRHCCLCEEYKGGKVEVHHIVPRSQGGRATADNGIVLCYDCHAEVHAYWQANPRGRKLTPSELRKRRDQWFEKFQTRGQPNIDYEKLAEALAPHLQRLKEEILEEFNHWRAVPEKATGELVSGAPPHRLKLLEQAAEAQREHRYRDAVAHLRAALTPDLPARERASLLNLMGNALINVFELAEAQEAYEQSIAAATQARDEEARAAALGNLGAVCFLRGDLGRAEANLKEARDLHRRIGGPRGEAANLCNLGSVYLGRHDLTLAEQCFREALRIHERLDDPVDQAKDLGNLGLVYAARGDLDSAEEHHKRSLDINRRINNAPGEAAALGNLGVVYAARGHLDRAEEYYKQALHIDRRIDNPLGQGKALANLALVAERRGRLQEARRLVTEAVALFDRVGAAPDAEKARRDLARLEVARPKPPSTRRRSRKEE
jgi:tetratricopeptide (TPR) repeat protein